MLKLNLQYFGHLMLRANSLDKALMLGKIEGKWRSGQQRVRWLNGVIGHEFEQTLGDSKGQGSLLFFSQSTWLQRIRHDLRLNNNNGNKLSFRNSEKRLKKNPA